MDDASLEPTVMPLDLIREITDGFSEERKLGSGSYGKVYLGVHQDGHKIAVKMIYDMPGVDDKQFQNEFENLTRLQHQNIVRLVGYCHDIQEIQVMHEGKLVLAEKTHRALCLEYMSNGSLEKYLSDKCDKYDWHTGYGIIKGICQGLKYLHDELDPPIHHLDLKPANILLDENMVPRIADFGISRLLGDEQTRATKSTLGTLGYLPPEYINSNLISSKFDIFSLGVVIIKIMAGRARYFKSTEMSSQEFTNVVQEIWMGRLRGTSYLMKAYSKQVKICTEIGLSCVQGDRRKRPTIQDIVDRLNETETECTYPFLQQNGSLPAKVLPNKGASQSVKLRFIDFEPIKDTLYTDFPVQQQGEKNAKVAIFVNDSQIKYGDLSKLQIEILPVHADFFTERGLSDFTKEEFSKQICTFKGKETVLKTFNLTNGESYIGPLFFTESSYRKEFRLTARVKRQDLAVRVQEAITNPFVIKDRRRGSNEIYPRHKDKPVHRLAGISRDGSCCSVLADKNITTVKHLMRHYYRDKSGLQKLISMKEKDWNTLINHAAMSDPGNEIYSYRVAEENTELLFNDFYDLVGMMIDGFYVPINDLDQLRQLKVNDWIMSAYKIFDERENSVGLTPDYVMKNDRPVKC